MIQYTAYTLVDISNTKARKINTLTYYQQQNLNTLIQTIGLRSQPLDWSIMSNMAQDIVDYGFGKEYKGLHTVWNFTFSIEHARVFENDAQELGLLLADVDGIPVYTDLEETVRLKSKCFEALNLKNKNIVFHRIERMI